MEKRIFNKLVRDGVPEKLTAKGVAFSTRVLEPQEMREALLMKVREEVEELVAARSVDEIAMEIADVFDVAEALLQEAGISAEEFARVRSLAQAKGLFTKRLFLEWTQDDGYGERESRK